MIPAQPPQASSLQPPLSCSDTNLNMSSDYVSASDENPNRPSSHTHHLRLSDPDAAGPSPPEAADIERPHSAGEVPGVRTRPGRVRFNSKSEVSDFRNARFNFPLEASPADPSRLQPQPQTKKASKLNKKGLSLPKTHTIEADQTAKNPFSDAAAIELQAPVPKKPRPSVLRNNSASSFTEDMMATGGAYKDDQSPQKAYSALAAQERAQRVASLVGSNAAQAARHSSGEGTPSYPPSPLPRNNRDSNVDGIPLIDMDRSRYNDGGIDSDWDEDDVDEIKERKKQSSSSEAHKLVRSHTGRAASGRMRFSSADSPALESGQVTPIDEQDYTEDYVARPDQYRNGVLSSLLKLYNTQGTPGHKRTTSSSSLGGFSTFSTPGSSGTSTPKQKTPKWYTQKNQSRDTLAGLVEASSILAAPAGGATTPSGKRPAMHSRTHSGLGKIDQAFQKLSRPRLEEEIKITVHIAETLSRQKYLIRLCRALMTYGAPTHRLEEYMRMTARVLELDGQFLYIPGCMLVSFDDAQTHTTEVKLVRTNQGINLGKLKDTHQIYKEVVHDVIGVEEATQRLDAIIREKPKHHKWLLVLVYGFASALVGPYAFEANFIDLPISFILGCILGFLQLILAPRSDLYANVFEVSAAVVTSFLARGFGSIPYNGGRLFCFSALAQSSIVLILPGYTILCGSLELQSKSIVAGSVRMFYAVIYSLFLGFGITIGTALYGLMDKNATSATSCDKPMNQYVRFVFVPFFTMCLCIINQAKWKQTPVMIIISFSGYMVNFFTSRQFPSNSQISQTLGALVIGVMGNLYSRLRHGVAAAALLPAIFVQVPSGLAASGSLLAGLTSADGITNSVNGTAPVRKLLQAIPPTLEDPPAKGKTALSFIIGTGGALVCFSNISFLFYISLYIPLFMCHLRAYLEV